MSVITVLISCMITIILMVLVYEYRMNRVIKNNNRLRKNNINLISSIGEVANASDRLVVDYKTIIEVARERFTDDEIDELFLRKREEVERTHINERLMEYDDERFRHENGR